MLNKYLIILCFIWCFTLTGCVTDQSIATPTVKHLSTSQIKNYVCTGEYDLKHFLHAPFTVDYEGNFYITHHTIDYRMNIKKYNSQGKYITTWVPEIKKRKKNCWFSERKHPPNEEELTDILADKENIYITYGAAYDISESMYSTDYTGHIEQFDPNGKFITTIKPRKDSFHRDFVRYIIKDKNGNFYLASWRHIEKYDTNWEQQSILYPFKQKWYVRSDYPDYVQIRDLAVDSEEYIYILIWCDRDNGMRISKFDSTGKFIKEFPNDKYKLLSYALEIDSDDNIYVLGLDEKETYHIRKFDSNGNFITEWKAGANGDIFASSYNDMKIDSKGNVYVDSGKGSIKKFSPKQ